MQKEGEEQEREEGTVASAPDAKGTHPAGYLTSALAAPPDQTPAPSRRALSASAGAPAVTPSKRALKASAGAPAVNMP